MPPAGVDLRISTGERHGFGALTPLVARASSLHTVLRAEASTVSPKLVQPIGSSSWTRSDEIFPDLPSGAKPSLLLRVFLP